MDIASGQPVFLSLSFILWQRLCICRLCSVMAKFTAALSTDNIRTALLGETRASKWSRSALASARVISVRGTYCSFCLPKKIKYKAWSTAHLLFNNSEVLQCFVLDFGAQERT